MEYREEHQISPKAPLALLVEGKQRARHYYRQGDVMRSREGVGVVQALVALVLEHAGTSPTSV